ncbi:MAG: FAD-binding protein, partial [Candidatus Cloacimonadaceae bacterium]|nr:FAD-binding protein [Candidatus Cloacimonadaceae bacterium]
MEASINIQALVTDRFADLIELDLIRFDEALSLHTSFEIGGPADVWFTPDTQARFIAMLIFVLQNRIPYTIIGKGSNLLVGDRGIRGIVINTDLMTKITRDEIYVSAFCGTPLSELCEFAAEQGLAGLEFASGIPGSVGGAVFMNAGAYGGEIKDVLYCSKCLSPTLEVLQSSNPVLHLKAINHDFSYRHSALQRLGYIHLSSVFKLHEDDPAAIKSRMQDLHEQRWEKQPMDLPSGGSV